MNNGIIAQVRSPVPTPYGLLGAVTPVQMPNRPINPEALDWAARVAANGGGEVSRAVLYAVSLFCNRIEAAGLRPLLTRVSPMAGDSLLAALVPLYRSTTPFDTVVGNETDTNDNFVAADYAPFAGLLGNGSNKRLLTGVPLNHATTRHLGAFVHTLGTTAFRTYVGASGATGFDGALSLQCDTPVTICRMDNYRTTADGQTAGGPTTGLHASGEWLLGTSAGTNVVAQNENSALYRNGSRTGVSGAANAPGLVSTGFSVFAVALSTGSFSAHSNARIGGYSIGLHLTANQAAAYSAAWLALLAGLGRR